MPRADEDDTVAGEQLARREAARAAAASELHKTHAEGVDKVRHMNGAQIAIIEQFLIL